MRLFPSSRVVCALALAVVGCGRDRTELTSAAADAKGKAAPTVTTSPSADDPERLCGATSKCPKELVDAETAMVCASLARDPSCGTPFLALVKCQIEKEKCGADGKADQEATMRLCKVEDAALQACNQAKGAAAKPSAK